MNNDTARIGEWMTKIWEDEKKLDILRKCGNQIAHQLRVISDCLNTAESAEATGFPDDHLFSSDHDSQAFLQDRPPLNGNHRVFAIPQNVEEVMREIYTLEQSIERNKKLLEEEKKKIQADN